MRAFALALSLVVAPAAEAQDAICTNHQRLNAEFIALVGEHLAFEPSIRLNASGPAAGNVGRIWVIASDAPLDSIMSCTNRYGVDQTDLTLTIAALRADLEKVGEPHAGVPAGITRDIGKAFEISGLDLFISVSSDESARQAVGAVAHAHGVHPNACWHDTECREAIERFWLSGRNE